MQKTGFDFEVIIADDYSRDGTLRIAREYAYPNVRILPTEAHFLCPGKKKSLTIWNFVSRDGKITLFIF
jgi:glycosyltransferase involved in cell wall biosynthesis